MSRAISVGCASLGLMVTLASARVNLLAAEKALKPNPAEAKTREEVLAALRAEAAGDNEQRAKLLASAAAIAPELAEANWHLAKVQVGGKWRSLAAAQEYAANDPQLVEYRKLRNEAENNAKLTRNLARWCTKAGFSDLARLHDLQLLSRGDVDSETQAESIKRLDLHNVAGTWLTSEELKQRQERARSVEAALRQWRARLKRLQMVIDSTDYAARDKAIEELAAIDDSQVILVLESFLLDGGDRFSEEAVRLLSRFGQIEATESLVRFAVLSQYSAARDAAIKALKERPKHDYMPLLVSSLVAPLQTQFSIAVGNRGTVSYTQTVVEENPAARLVRVRNQVALPGEINVRTGGFSHFGGRAELPLVLSQVAKAEQAALETQVQATLLNSQREGSNRRVFEVLEQLADAQIPRDASLWWNWWQDYNQYYWPKQTYYAYGYQASSYIASCSFRNLSCFVAGTRVRTQMGLEPIESIRAGDRVLAQGQNTGELTYKAVMRTTVRPPAKMVRIDAGSDQITTTLGHPFWVDGYGWKMARELVAGDRLHSLGGAVRVEKVEPAGENKAYNLVVDNFNTYFVGQEGLLVHDNEYRKPTRAIVPGLIEEVAVGNAK
jgi:pretoxin HINT domain-containing protein/HEAT repeat protein